MRWRRSTAAALSALVVIATLVLGASSANAATTSATICTSYTSYHTWYSGSSEMRVPTAGYQTGKANCILRYGNNNFGVHVLQESLRECWDHSITIDGVYGPQTRGAILAIQRNANSGYGAGIDEDGIYGPQTRNWMQWLLYPPAGSCWPPPV
jgi:peptidoglycan hydrolase-like protein with peptidoglycan-binding domain